MTETGLWPFALATYQRPGVEAALLELQDDHGQCVPYLIWALWLAASGRAADRTALAAGAAIARPWQEAAIQPLRALRRRLREPIALADPENQAQLREAVKALELDAERRLLAALEAASPTVGPGAPVALAEAIQAWGGAAPPQSIERLAALTATA